MSDHAESVFGIFRKRVDLDNAVKILKDAGFRKSDISILFPNKKGTTAFAHEKNTKAPEGAFAGGGTGLALGGTLGWLAGIGALAIPGIGPFIAAGPIIAALAGAGVGGLLGGMTGALVGMGIPEYEAKRYEDIVKEGGFLISLHSDKAEWTKKGKTLLQACGARNIESTSALSPDRVPLEIHSVL